MVEEKLSSDHLAVAANSTYSLQRATVDNFAVLLGLLAYAYLCDKTSMASEASWARSRYPLTRDALENKLLQLVASKPASQRYLSASVDKLTDAIYEAENANAHAPFFFGRMYELFLFGDTLTRLVPLIDNALDVNLARNEGSPRMWNSGA